MALRPMRRTRARRPLPMDGDLAGVEIDVGDGECGKLADTAAGVDQNRQDGQVAAGHEVLARAGRQQRDQLVLAGARAPAVRAPSAGASARTASARPPPPRPASARVAAAPGTGWMRTRPSGPRRCRRCSPRPRRGRPSPSRRGGRARRASRPAWPQRWCRSLSFGDRLRACRCRAHQVVMRPVPGSSRASARPFPSPISVHDREC